jgi:hypothetical protein
MNFGLLGIAIGDDQVGKGAADIDANQFHEFLPIVSFGGRNPPARAQFGTRVWPRQERRSFRDKLPIPASTLS